MIPRILRKCANRLILARPLTRVYNRISPQKTLGARGELEAERYLLKQGYIVVHRGYSDKFGEIDLVAVDNRTIVFVEVKTRTSDSAGLPSESVDETKQKHLTQTALGYLKWNRLTECKSRFDVVAILWPSTQSDPSSILHYENAFEPAGEFQIY